VEQVSGFVSIHKFKVLQFYFVFFFYFSHLKSKKISYLYLKNIPQIKNSFGAWLFLVMGYFAVILCCYLTKQILNIVLFWWLHIENKGRNVLFKYVS
jgi:hypothetical protein